MLEGYDEDWQNAPVSRTAWYNNLPSGTYKFKVKAFLIDSPEKYDLKEIEVIVPPSFLMSRNAMWIYLAIGVVLCVEIHVVAVCLVGKSADFVQGVQCSQFGALRDADVLVAENAPQKTESLDEG